MLDLIAQHRAIKTEVMAAVEAVFESQHFILGPAVEKCEKEVAAYASCAHGIGVSSGSDALLIALMAEGIGPGDEVITTPFTFFATAGAIARLGATPIFADIDPATYNLDPRLVEAKITPRTKAIIPVHLYGQVAELGPILALAKERGLIVIEDAAQAIGARNAGASAGSLGQYGCFSFFPSKNLGAAGDAGLVVTNDPARAEKLSRLRSHGSKPKYYHKVIGGNFRLDAVQAAVVSAKLPHLDQWTRARQANAERYHRLFRASGIRVAESASVAGGGLDQADLLLPLARAERHIYNQYVVRTRRRDALKTFLREAGVETEIYYPVPMHLQECFAYLGHRPGAFPESESAANEVLALPVYPELTQEQAEHVVASVVRFFRSAA